MYEPNQFLAMAAWHTLQNGSTTERTQTSLERERTGSRPAVDEHERQAAPPKSGRSTAIRLACSVVNAWLNSQP